MKIKDRHSIINDNTHYLNFRLGILKYPQLLLIIEEIVHFTTINLKEARTDDEVLTLMIDPVQPEHISS